MTPGRSSGDVAAGFCATLADEWARAGVTDAVVAPGSRSTPMALAVAAERRLRVHVHHDERSAGFLAVGLGLATSRPAVVVTTSGTAAVELHPAIVEAHQSRVPLIAVTADRPPDLHHVGAPQTVDQTRLYGAAVRWFVEPGVPDDAGAGSWRSLGARSVAEAGGEGASGPPGPVHLNLAFREPLAGDAGALPGGRADDQPWHTADRGRITVTRQGVDRLAGLLDTSRGVIVAGAGAGDPAAVLELAEAVAWPVLADPRSGCRVPHPAVVSCFDALLRDPRFAGAHRPSAVLRLGDLAASKELGQWLAGSAATQVAVHAHGRWIDPDHSVAHVVHADPTAVCTALSRAIGEPDPAWAASWAVADATARAAIDQVIGAHAEPTEPGVARDTMHAVPDGGTLVVSSSMPVRDLEWFAAPRRGVTVFANRGANGIDGVVSTAVGVALAEPRRPTVALLGDVALLHDTNGLLGAAVRPVDLTLVVVDNDGGGIFSFLPLARSGAVPAALFEQLFGTPHGVDLPVLAAAHGIMTIEPVGAAEVPAAVAASVAAGGVRLVRVRTDRAANVAVHDEIVAEVARRLADS